MNIRVNSIVDLNEAIVYYSNDLPDHNILDEELSPWQTKWLAVKHQDRPETISDPPSNVSLLHFPTCLHLLKLFGTIPLAHAPVKDWHLHLV